MVDDAEISRTTDPQPTGSPFVFFGLVFCLSIPFYWLGAAGGQLPVLTAQPISALMAFMPMTAALILVCRDCGIGAAAKLLARALDYGRARRVFWCVGAVCLLPFIAIVQYLVLHLIGTALPSPIYAIGGIPLFLMMYFAGAVGEELGWQGYAFPSLRAHHNSLMAAVLIGVFWALWHIVPFLQMGRAAGWIVWHGLSIVALRVVMVWLFVRTGQSIFVASMFHMMINLPWSVIANYGAFYDPQITLLILLLPTGLMIAFWRTADTPQDRISYG